MLSSNKQLSGAILDLSFDPAFLLHIRADRFLIYPLPALYICFFLLAPSHVSAPKGDTDTRKVTQIER